MTKKVLVVDDQPGIRLLLEEVIRDEGYHVTSVSTGAQALEAIASSVPDLLLIDYKLPVLDGPGVLEKMQSQNLFVPSILMSGLAEEAEQYRQAYDFLIDVLAKPFDIMKVKTIVKKILSE